MIAAPPEHVAEWLAPAPLWGLPGAALAAPAVVRLDGDDFMGTFAGLLAPRPGRAGGVGAARAGAAAASDEDKEPDVLYQPVHGCYALVCASLTCRAAGRPEKSVAPAAGDVVGFVIRRIEGGAEFAWIPAGGGIGAWVPARGLPPVDGEELHPLFPVPLPGAAPRRVWAGVVPTASRETYLPVPDATPPATEPDDDWRIAVLKSGPLEVLTGDRVREPAPGVPDHDALLSAAVTIGLQAVLEVADFLNEYVLRADGDAPADLVARLTRSGPAGQELVRVLNRAGLVKAIADAIANREALLQMPGGRLDVNAVAADLSLPLSVTLHDDLVGAVWAALPTTDPPAPPAAARGPLPKYDLAVGADPPREYVVRCIYTREHCPPVSSGASPRFKIAPVHDPRAPARTIRIPMPADVSVAGLRRLKKSVGFVLSEGLNAKVQALSGKKLKDIDDGNVSAGGSGMAEICTFALPIIMLCAMIVLFLFLALLNIAFFWLPFVKICLPLPKGRSP